MSDFQVAIICLSVVLVAILALVGYAIHIGNK